MNDTIIVMRDSPEAAVYESRTGWWSRNGHFWGEDEHMARHDGCTHQPCEDCGAPVPKAGLVVCPDCRRKRVIARYAGLERVPWTGQPLCEYDGDWYFWEIDELYEAIADGEASDDLLLVIAEPVRPRVFDVEDFLSDDLPEDADVPADIVAAAVALNTAIADAAPLCWRAGKTVPVFPAGILAEMAEAAKERP